MAVEIVRLPESAELTAELLMAAVDAMEMAAGVGGGQRTMEDDMPSDLPGRAASMALIISYDESVLREVNEKLFARGAGGRGIPVGGATVRAARWEVEIDLKAGREGGVQMSGRRIAVGVAVYPVPSDEQHAAAMKLGSALPPLEAGTARAPTAAPMGAAKEAGVLLQRSKHQTVKVVLRQVGMLAKDETQLRAQISDYQKSLIEEMSRAELAPESSPGSGMALEKQTWEPYLDAKLQYKAGSKRTVDAILLSLARRTEQKVDTIPADGTRRTGYHLMLRVPWKGGGNRSMRIEMGRPGAIGKEAGGRVKVAVLGWHVCEGGMGGHSGGVCKAVLLNRLNQEPAEDLKELHADIERCEEKRGIDPREVCPYFSLMSARRGFAAPCESKGCRKMARSCAESRVLTKEQRAMYDAVAGGQTGGRVANGYTGSIEAGHARTQGSARSPAAKAVVPREAPGSTGLRGHCTTCGQAVKAATDETVAVVGVEASGDRAVRCGECGQLYVPVEEGGGGEEAQRPPRDAATAGEQSQRKKRAEVDGGMAAGATTTQGDGPPTKIGGGGKGNGGRGQGGRSSLSTSPRFSRPQAGPSQSPGVTYAQAAATSGGPDRSRSGSPKGATKKPKVKEK